MKYYFKKQVWDGSDWVNTGDVDVKTTQFLVSPAPTTAITSKDKAAVEPGTTISSGSSFTIVAEGDRQFADGIAHGDKKIVPDKWISTEYGSPSGSFTLGSDNRYTSVYTPSMTGTFKVTVSFKAFEYDGYAKEWKSTQTIQPPDMDLYVTVQAYNADKLKNKLTISSTTINGGETVTLTAEGDKSPNGSPSYGDTRYLPLTWSSSENGGNTGGSFTLGADGSYTAQYTPQSGGTMTLDAKFMRQMWYNDQWNDQPPAVSLTSPPTLTVIIVIAKADPAKNSITANPSVVSSKETITLTAKGDRQEVAAGKQNTDERYVPLSWKSSENGKSVTFTQDSDGNYTSDYKPSAAGNYVVTATFEKQMWYGGIWYYNGTDTKTVNVTAVAMTADADNNKVSANPSSVASGGTVTLTAEGDGPAEDDAFVGDERYVPVDWSSTESGKTGTFAKDSNGKYTSDYKPAAEGTHTVTVTFQKQTWDGTAWNDVSGATDTKTTTVTVTAVAQPQPTEADAGSNGVSANPSSVTSGTSITLTAAGDRQSANGTVVGDERYVPVSWSSTESGKLGTFTKDNNGNYTSAYTPSASGSHTVTATFELQMWNGTTWVAVAGATDTKTTTVTVTAVTQPTQPTEADADNNTVSASSNSVTSGTAVKLTAIGDRQSEDGAIAGDERYVPVSWSSTESGKTGTFTKNNNGNYTSAYTPSAAGSYTVTATFQKQTWNGTTWVAVAGATDTKTTTVTVSAAAEPNKANAGNNKVNASPDSVTSGGTVTLTAEGDRQADDGTIAGDERYVPVSWRSTESGKTGTFTKDGNGSYTASYKPSAAGDYTVTATFQKEKWNGTAWVAVTGTTDTKTITVTATATTADANSNVVNASPSSVTTGRTVMLTAGGDRQSAVGAFVGDERYVPVSWSSTESGKTGTFMKNGSGSYTSAYLPSAVGSHTVTATFQKEKWNGTAWVAVSGTTDTKTTTVTVTAATEPTEADSDNNSVSASPDSVTTGGKVTLTAAGDRESADGAFVGDERYVPISWSSTESGKMGTFAKDRNGNYTSFYSPSTAGSHTVTVTFQKQTWNGTEWETAAGSTDTKTFTVTVRNGGSSPDPSPSTGNSSESNEASESEDGVIVLVNGKVEKAGIAKSTTINGLSGTIVIVDQKKLEDKLAAEGFGAVVTVPVSTKSDVVVAQLNGQLIQEMEDLHATLVVKTDRAIYTVPSLQINMNEISNQIGKTVSLQDIKVELQFGTTPDDMAKVVSQAATNGSYTPVLSAMDFIVKWTYGDKTEEVAAFSVYVERAIAIPDGIDPNKITTGVVVDPDGTSRHVPTKVMVIDGKYYAVINSLTNSTYSVVWHPIEFSDVENHWARDAANDMGSRMVAEGTGNGKFSPNRDITRAEFVAIIVRGLGLKPSKEAAPFSDIKESDWYKSAISTAYAYGLIDGIGDGSFRPQDKITREQAMVIIAKAMKITGLNAKLSEQSAESLFSPFADASASSDWAKSSIANSIQAGIIMGRSGTQLAPKAYITRAEVAAVIQRLLRKSELI
ncbi:S-layer homology domain-containing protein [Cohnella sp. AR92]|uniref:S-layer homology domain-containing protein n=1 Tax=Cohnella sp. AR92 TaxID=648716 RepID=UPI0013156FB8|nr:S-layer homology domain-containing protein [Cohnella sp. AR92]